VLEHGRESPNLIEAPLNVLSQAFISQIGQRAVQHDATRGHGIVTQKIAKDSIDQEITELKTQNSALHVKIGKLNENHAHTVNQFVDSIVSLSKLRNEINLIQIGRKRQTEELKQLQKEREFDFIEKCMTKFDNFCHISPTSAGQDFPTPESQLMRTDGILSRASTTLYYVFNQMRRILGIVAGLQLMDPDQ
jgi:hypothetical protein